MMATKTQSVPRTGKATVIAFILALAADEMYAADADAKVPPDKSHYTLFNPTPRELWRELSPDRPDATESPITLDAGALALETSLFDYRYHQGDETYTVMANNLKIGLNNNMDLQMVFDTYTLEDPEAGDSTEGFSDIQIRLKYNLWGNDGGKSAFALFPYVKIPTGTDLSNDEFEGGLILPFGLDLMDGVGLGLMPEIDVVYDDSENDHRVQFLHSAVVGFDLTDRLGMFNEYVGVVSEEPYEAYYAGGFTFSVHDDFILDCGAQIGLNENSDDFGVFLGFTKRF